MTFIMIVTLIVSLFAIGLTLVTRPEDDERKHKRKNDARSGRRTLGYVLIAVALVILLLLCGLTFLILPDLPQLE